MDITEAHLQSPIKFLNRMEISGHSKNNLLKFGSVMPNKILKRKNSRGIIAISRIKVSMPVTTLPFQI